MSSKNNREHSAVNSVGDDQNTDNDADSLPSTTSSRKTSSSQRTRYSFQKRPFVIGVAGGTASGKSTVCSKIMEKLGPIDPTSIYLSHEKRVICISQDSFYRKLNAEDKALVSKGNFNFDHPSAFDVELLIRTLRDVLNGKMVKVPVYNYMENEIGDTHEVIYPADVVLVEGLLLFYFPEVRQMFNMKIFVDTDPDTRLSRRVMRDVKERNRELDVVLNQYTKFVKPSFEEFCLPTKKYADIIVPRGPDNEVAVDLILTHVRSVYDPSIRHQSIKYCDVQEIEQPFNLSRPRSAAATHVCTSDEFNESVLDQNDDVFDADIMCSTNVNGVSVYESYPFANNCHDEPGKHAIKGVGRSVPVPIHKKLTNEMVTMVNGAGHLASSSAPSHFTHGTDGTAALMINNGDYKSSQSPRVEATLTASNSKSKAIVNASMVSSLDNKTGSGSPSVTSTATNKSPASSQAAPILMVASR